MNQTAKGFFLVLTFIVGITITMQVPVGAKTAYKTTKTQEVARIKTTSAKIYSNPTKLKGFKLAAKTHTSKTYEANSKTKIGKTTYYQLSQGKTKVGWLATKDITRHKRILQSTKKTTAYIAGTHNSYNMPWGTTKNKVSSLSSSRAKEFKAIRIEKIGSTLWYKGTLNNKTVWISQSALKTNPYTALNLRKPSNVTAKEMQNFLISKGKLPNNVLYKLAPTFVTLQKEAGINAQFMLAHAILETGWGSSTISQYKNNYFGYQAYDTCALTCAKYFPSGKAGLSAYAYKIYRDYLTSSGAYYNGPTLIGMNVRYATDPEWSDKIANLMAQMKSYSSSYYSKKTASKVVFKEPKEYNNVIPVGKPQPDQFLTMPDAIKAKVDVAEGAQIYSLPYVYSAQYGTYKKGKVITLKAYHTDVRDFTNTKGKMVRWYRIDYSGKQGWLRSDQIAVANLGFTNNRTALQNDKYTQVASVNKNALIKLVKKDNKYVTKTDKKKVKWYQIYKTGSTKKLWIKSSNLQMFN